MQLIVTASIKKNEFEPLEDYFPLEAIKIAAQKSLEGLGESIKSSYKIPSTSLKKLYLTGKAGAGRAIFLLTIGTGKSALVMIRMKNDKQIGANMTVKNPKFKKALEKNLDMILCDLENEDYEEYPL